MGNGTQALTAVRRARPDLLLTDVMMPEMDGFQLLSAIRGDAALRGLPVIMLSARAGEESRSEGLEAGADDYLIKPFSSRELLARVDAQLVRAQLRVVEERQSERMRTIFREAPVGIAILTGPELRFEFANQRYAEIVGNRQLLGRGFREAFPELVGQGAIELVEQVRVTGEPFASPAYRAADSTALPAATRRRPSSTWWSSRSARGARPRRGRGRGRDRRQRAGDQPASRRGGQPRQGRVPGDARPRAAQPAGAAGHRAAPHEAARPGRRWSANGRSSSGR